MIVDLVRTMVGQAPVGFEALEYVACSVLALFMIREVLYLIRIPGEIWVSGRKERKL